MEILIYNRGKAAIRYKFKPEELDKIRQICYDMGIKYYVINYNRSE